MNYQQLTERQRDQIALLYKENCSCREIGQRVGVSKSTISRELRRNGTTAGYVAQHAQRQSELRRVVAAKRSVSQSSLSLLWCGSGALSR